MIRRAELVADAIIVPVQKGPESSLSISPRDATRGRQS
jgi:hypothetical protein